MKLLDKRTINTQKASEQKREIDEGVKLATAVDKLREQLQIEKKNLLEWREQSIKQAKYEIGQYIEERDNLKKQNDEARTLRDELLKPLNNEWAEMNKVKAELAKEKQRIYLSGEQLKIAEQKLKTREKDISVIVSKVKRNEQETEKAKSEAISLREMAAQEYEIAKDERAVQTGTLEKALSSLKQREHEYEVALKTIEVREKECEEKEAELLSEKQHLESQQNTLRIAREAIQ